jgi:hypothetical protein
VVQGEFSASPPPFGQRRFYHVYSKGREDLPEPAYVGSREAVGAAYLFRFPFDIYISDDLTEIQTSYIEKTTVHLYPLFLDSSEPGIETHSIAPERIPFRPGTLPPSFNKVVINRIVQQSHRGRRSDSLRMDFVPDRGSEFAMQIAEQFVGLARWWTYQWWIGQPRRITHDHAVNWFRINEAGERLEGIQNFASVYGDFGIERPLDLELFRNIRGNLTNGRRIPLSWDLFLDAIYFAAIKDLRRALLELAIGCEARIGEETQRICERDGISERRVKRALRSNDFTVQLDRGLGELAGREFPKEKPDEWKLLQLLRTARGNVAHGGDLIIPTAGGSRRVTDKEVADMLYAALSLYHWLGDL